MLNNELLTSPESVFYDYQKKMENQLCQVCQNMAVGFHYGAYVCEACKKFFKRYLLNHSVESVTCKEDCDIDRVGRRKCADCRYKKCLRVGMRLSISKDDKHGFDISKIPCRICGNKSSGFHFGSLTCEGCKGFFRRADSIKDRLTCSSKNECYINFNNRSMCKYCRYQQCLKAGMSKAGSRIGRQPNAVKHHCVLEIANSETKQSTSSENTYAASDISLPDSSNEDPGKCEIKVEPSLSKPNVLMILSNIQEPTLKTFYTKLVDAMSIMQMPFREAMMLLQIPRKQLRDDQTLLEVWNIMMQHFDVHSHMLIQFAKKIPIFNDLSLVDKRIIVQEAMYPIILLNLARSYSADDDERFNYFDFSELEYRIILKHFPSIHTIMSHVMNISRLVHNLKFSSKQIGLFCVLELLKNYHHLESESSVKVYYHHTVRICWATIVDQLMDSSENDATSDKMVTDTDVTSSLTNLLCPYDLVDTITKKLLTSNTNVCLQKLRIVFVYFGQWLQKYNLEHQTIIDQLKLKHPELPYSELYVEMFQLSTSST